MAVTKKEFTDLLGESISADLASEAAPTERTEQVFSEAFEKRMSDFFSGKAVQRKKAKSNPKRWLIVAIAAVLLLAAVACAVPEVRRSIAGFFVRMFGDHVEYTDPDITKDRIEEEYGLVPIPEGFELNTESGSKTRTLRYEDGKGRYIIFIQTVDAEIQISVDNEEGEFSEQTIANKSCRIYISDDGSQASWLENGYFFSMTCSAGLDIIDMIECVRTIDE